MNAFSRMTWYCGITTPNRTGTRFCRRTITMDSQTCFLRVNLRVPADVRCSSKRPTCDTVVGGPLHHIWRTRRVTEGAVPLRLREYLQSTFLVSWKLIKLPLSLEQRIAQSVSFPVFDSRALKCAGGYERPTMTGSRDSIKIVQKTSNERYFFSKTLD